jgi:hypothetical protein
MSENLPADARVGLTGPTAEFAFLPHEGWDVWPSLTSLRDNDATYVLTASQPLTQGYGYAAPELLTWLQENATPVFTTYGPSNGDTVVWQLDREALEQAVDSGVTLPPINGGHP